MTSTCLWHQERLLNSALCVILSAAACFKFTATTLECLFFFTSGQTGNKASVDMKTWSCPPCQLRPERQADKLQVEQGDKLGRERGTERQHRNNDLWIWNLVWMIAQDWNEHTAFDGSLKAPIFLLKPCKHIEVQTEGVWVSALYFTVRLGKWARAQCQNRNPRLSLQATQVLPSEWNKPAFWLIMLLC